jgi:hypothetical protein
MDIGSALPTNAKAFELVQPGQRALHNPALAAQPRAVGDATPSDHRADPARPQRPPVAVEVVAAVGQQYRGTPPRPAPPAGHRPDGVDQRQQLGDVVGVAAGQRDRERDPAGVADEVVLAAWACAVDRACARLRPPLRARRWAASITARDSRAGRPGGAGPAAAGGAGPTRQRRSSPAAAASRSCRSVAKLLGQLLPGDAGGQHVQDAVQDGAVIQRPAAGVAVAARACREQGLDELPELVVHGRMGMVAIGVGGRTGEPNHVIPNQTTSFC